MNKPTQGLLFGGPIDFSKPQLVDICAGKHGGNANSQAAHAKALPTASAERQAILDWLRHRGRQGGSRKEYQDFANRRDGLNRGLNCFSGRFSELIDSGEVVETGRRDAGSGIVVLKGFADRELH